MHGIKVQHSTIDGRVAVALKFDNEVVIGGVAGTLFAFGAKQVAPVKYQHIIF